MSQDFFQAGNLVLYKNRPARVKHATDQPGSKIDIEPESGKAQSVRSKDIMLLHPGPFKDFSSLQQPPPGDLETAWELLIGELTTLAELAELIYGNYTPTSAWTTWLLVADGLYFNGTPESVNVIPAAAQQQEAKRRHDKAVTERNWEAFVERVRAQQIIPTDHQHLRETENLAWNNTQKSRLMRSIDSAETPENAHALLLKLDYWNPYVNPYPRRLDLPLNDPVVELPELPTEDRRDLTHLTALAIDDTGSTDPDDAISLEGSRLWVHIADVAALITPDSPADLEARSRAANLYLPEGTIHMLPPSATKIFGLGLNSPSPALSFGLDLDNDGIVRHLDICPSWIKVTRLSYDQAEAAITSSPLRELHQIAQRAQEQRFACGAIHIDWPEVKLRVSNDGISILPLPVLQSRMLVTEAMLLAGQAIANFAQENNLEFPFTTQAAPANTEPVGNGYAGMLALRKRLKPSQQQSLPGPHAGLGLPLYSQATSPLRRYLDLVAHQQLRSYLKAETPLNAQELITRSGTAQAIAGATRQAERLSNRHWTLVYLQELGHWQGEGIIIEQRQRQATLLIPSLALETPFHGGQDQPLNAVLPVTLQHVNLPRQEVRFTIST